MAVVTAMAWLALAIWLYLMMFRGGFWRADQRLPAPTPDPGTTAEVAAVIPARDEAEVIEVSLRSLIDQDYSGKLTIVLVDDHSRDGTRDVAARVAREHGRPDRRLVVADADELPPKWSGKLWAMAQGVDRAADLAPDAEYLLLTDADIAHAPDNLRGLIAKAEAGRFDMVSLMVLLAYERGWSRLLVPAFVFFFQKLYPFPLVNNPARPEAGAAGGCMLVRRTALQRAGGIESIRTELIDDCALGRRMKRFAQPGSGGIWLGLTDTTRSLRPYPGLADIWDMVRRTAFTQLHYSTLLLAGTVVGMAVIYLAPPVAALSGLITGDAGLAGAGLAAWLLMAAAFRPTLRLNRMPLYLAPLLPVAGLLYTAMTIDSAIQHWRGRSVTWKGRVYSPTADR